MHRDAEERMAQGFGWGPRLAIGIAALLGAACVASAARYSESPVVVVVVATVFACLGLACLLPPRWANPFGRIVGAAIFLACVGYLYEEFAAGNWYDGDDNTHAFNATLALIAFGLPGGYYAVFGRWRDGASTGDELDRIDTDE
jgi:hypothetical protein